MFRVCIYIVTFLIIYCNLEAQNRKLRVNVDGVKYDSLIIYGTNVDDKFIKIPGKQTGKSLWTFSIPNIEFNSLCFYKIIPKSFDPKTKTVRSSNFNMVYGRDTVSADWLQLYENMPILNLKYIGKEIKKEDLYINNIGLVKDGIRITHRFILKCDTTSDNYLTMKYPAFASFGAFDSTQLKYKDYLNEYELIAKYHPDSRYLMSQLYKRYWRFKNKNELKKVYEVFNDKMQNSYWGKRISRYLEFYKFPNMELPDGKTGVSEPIVKDSSKYTLVIFSASWCGPCHRLIPTLNQVYGDLEDLVNFVYISIDEKETVENWKKLMIDKEIPWRSLLAADNIPEVKERYFIYGIPQSYLVAPNGNLEEIDISESEGKNRLYNLVE